MHNSLNRGLQRYIKEASLLEDEGVWLEKRAKGFVWPLIIGLLTARSTKGTADDLRGRIDRTGRLGRSMLYGTGGAALGSWLGHRMGNTGLGGGLGALAGMGVGMTGLDERVFKS